MEKEPFVLETPRLLLRKMRLSDIDALSAIMQDERVMYAYNGAFNDEETAMWLERQLQRYEMFGFGLWAATLKETGEMIGQCGITVQPY